ncbi:MAG: hypothetical protein ACK5KP_07235 [Paludibacteraceae bacterium]
MENQKRRNIRIGIIVGVASLVLMFIIALLGFGYNNLFYDEENRFVLQFFVPIWALIFGWVGYGLSKSYYIQKSAVFDGEKDHKEKEEVWINYRRLIFANALNVIAKILLGLFPIYLLAYLDNSTFLPSNIPTMITLLVVGLVCLILDRYLKLKYKKNKTNPHISE